MVEEPVRYVDCTLEDLAYRHIRLVLDGDVAEAQD